MKRKNIIITLWLLWLFVIISIIFGVDKYIDHKRVKLRCDLRDNIEALFQGQLNDNAFVDNNDGFFYSSFNNAPVRHYKKVSIPSRPDKISLAGTDSKWKKIDFGSKIDEQINDEWKQNYGDISTLYELNWGDDYPKQNDEGWNITRIYCGGPDEEFIHINTIFPYEVGLKKSEWGNYYTVEQAVSEAYEFYTTNPKSGFSDRFKKGSDNQIWNYIDSNDNEYFTIQEKQKKGWIDGEPIAFPKGIGYEKVRRVMPYKNGWMENGYYRVYIAATQELVFGIQEKEWAVSDNRNKLLLLWCIGVSILFLLFIIPLTIKQVKSNKKKSETLYQRLVRLCNPKEFMDNYDKEKVGKANVIYQKLLQTKPDDKQVLIELQNQASTDLGINFIDKAELEELKEWVNPKRFINPYNAEKVSLANELYSILSKDDLTYMELMDVKERSKDL